jgi:hypothetical protein
VAAIVAFAGSYQNGDKDDVNPARQDWTKQAEDLDSRTVQCKAPENITRQNAVK